MSAGMDRDALQHLIENTSNLIQEVAPDTRFISVNRAWRKILGYTADEVHRLSMHDIVHPASRAHCMEAIQNLLEGKPVNLIEALFIGKNGETVEVVGSCHCRIRDGKPQSIQGIFQDVTERTRSERRLRESEDRFATVARTATDAIITINETSTVGMANASTERVFGYHPDELLHQPLTVLIPEAFRLNHVESLDRYVRTGKRHIGWDRVEFSALHKHGHEIAVEVSFGEYLADGEHFFTGIIRDVSERKLLEEQLRQSQKMESLGLLSAGIAHDFNNILSAMMLTAQGVRRNAWEPSQALDQIEQCIRRASTLTSQLLAFSRSQRVTPEQIDMNQVVLEMQNMLEQLLQAAIQIESHLEEGLACIQVGSGQLEQVIMNLAVNARDAMPDGGTLCLDTATVTIDVSTSKTLDGIPPGKYARLVVHDTGCGMSKDVLERAFEPFFTTKRAGEGTGLGLSTVFGIVKQAGGTLTAASIAEEETTITVYFPQTP